MKRIITLFASLFLFVSVLFAQISMVPEVYHPLISIDSEQMNPVLSSDELVKLHPLLQKAVAAGRLNMKARALPGMELPVGISANAEGELVYDVIIYGHRESDLYEIESITDVILNDFATARLTAAQLTELVSRPTIRYIDRSSISYPTMDVSMYDSRAHMLHRGFVNNEKITGEGVFLVVFDTGIDWKHADFRVPGDTSRSRIAYLYDVTLTGITGETVPAVPGYGVEYSRAEIEAAFVDPSKVRSFDTNRHGTHVMGTAGGSGSVYPGVAPGADLIVIRGGVNSFSLTNIINGLIYASNKGIEHNKPVVVNLSLGGSFGPRDGSRPDEQTIDVLSTEQTGYVVVTSSGNSGAQNQYVEATIGQNQSRTFLIEVPTFTASSGTNNDSFYFDIWTDTQQAFNAKLTAPNGTEYVQNGTGSFSNANTNGSIFISNAIDPGNNHRRIYFIVFDEFEFSPPASGVWTAQITPLEAQATVKAWLTPSLVGGQRVNVVGGNTTSTLGMPASSRETITVANYVTKASWVSNSGSTVGYSGLDGITQTIAASSSKGPTRDGRLKPEIAAPGTGIFAALSTSASAPNILTVGITGEHVALSGTSMASPHVAGVAALMLSTNPNLTAAEIKNHMIAGARIDNLTNLPDNTWGYGKLDALTAYLSMQGYSQEASTRLVTNHRSPVVTSGDVSVVQTLAGNVRYGLRFNSGDGGILTGLLLHTHDQISAEGRVAIEVFTEAENGSSFQPGEKVGNTAFADVSELQKRQFTYLETRKTAIPLEADRNYIVVISMENEEGSVTFLPDNGPLTTHNSIRFNGSNWEPLSVAASPPLRDMVMKVEITNYPDLTVSNPDIGIDLPNQITLSQNYPNPFNPVTQIRYTITPGFGTLAGNPDRVRLSVYDVLGREVAVLVDGIQPPGTYTVAFNAQQLASGVYLYRLEAGGQILNRKMTLVK